MRKTILLLLTVLFLMMHIPGYAGETAAGVPTSQRQYWRVEAYFWTSPGYNRYRVEMRKHPDYRFNWSIDTAKLDISVVDQDGKPVKGLPRLYLAPDTPAVLHPTRDKDGFDRATINLVLERGNTAPGAYAVRISGTIDAIDAETNESIDVPPIKVQSVVHLAWMPAAVPKLVPRQRFLFMPPDVTSKPNPFNDKLTGASVPWKEVVLRVLELRNIQTVTEAKSRLTFKVENRKGMVFLDTDPIVDKLPLIYPIVEDPAIAPLQKKLQNHSVWAYGGVSGSLFVPKPMGIAGIKGHPTDSVVIKRILRLYAPKIPMTSTGNAPLFRTDNPIIVMFETPVSIGISMGSWTTDATQPEPPGFANKVFSVAERTATGFYTEYCEPQELDRSFSLVHPFKLHKEWSKSVRQAVSKGDVIAGMTYDAAAWAWGWPPLRRSIAEMKKLNSWSYGYNSIEFQRGRVVSWGSDVTLP